MIEVLLLVIAALLFVAVLMQLSVPMYLKKINAHAGSIRRKVSRLKAVEEKLDRLLACYEKVYVFDSEEDAVSIPERSEKKKVLMHH